MAAAIGAANTLVRLPEGGWKAYNTDCLAATAAIERGLLERGGAASASPLAGGTVVVLGAGGAGRAVAFGAASRGARVVVANRSVEKARALAEALPVSPEQPGAHEGIGLAELGAVRDADVLANSTSVGMNGDGCPVQDDVDLARFRVVFDAVYTPLKTTLLQRAEVREGGWVEWSGGTGLPVIKCFALTTSRPRLARPRDAPLSRATPCFWARRKLNLSSSRELKRQRA